MKRDMDLARQILLLVEEHGKDPTGWVDVKSPDHSPEVVAHHVMLLEQAGLLMATNMTDSAGFDYKPHALTWAGHDFLDAARNDTVWNNTKKLVREKGGSVPFEVLKQLLTAGVAALFSQLMRPG